jgi:hypothetical protein
MLIARGFFLAAPLSATAISDLTRDFYSGLLQRVRCQKSPMISS